VNELTSLSQTELIEIILQLRAQLAELQAEAATLRARVAELEEENRQLRGGKGHKNPLAVKPSRPEREQKERKHREEGHGRARAQQVDEVRYHAAATCPECGRKLEGGWRHRSRQVVQVIFRTWVVEHVLVARECGICQKRWLPAVGPAEYGVQGKRRLGVSVQALVGLLHVWHRLPMDHTRQLLWEMGGLAVSNGGVVDLLDGLRKAGQSEVEGIRQQIRRSPAVHGDETGWREDGENGYLWGFFTPQVRYFEYHRTRGGEVPEEVLGEDFAGTLTCDFYGGYNGIDRLQRCWVHLLRDAKELAEINADRPEVKEWVEALGALYREAKDFSSPNPRLRRRKRKQLEARLAALARPYAEDAAAPQRVLSKRILKHLHELFVFVEDPLVQGDNNLAERSLRHAVIGRKISGGTRSAKGSATQTGLLSLFATWAAQGKPLLETCRELLLPTPAP